MTKLMHYTDAGATCAGFPFGPCDGPPTEPTRRSVSATSKKKSSARRADNRALSPTEIQRLHKLGQVIIHQ